VLLCLLVVPIAATAVAGGSGGPKATASAKLGKKLKQLNKKLKKLQAQLQSVSKQVGPQGMQGARGERGPVGPTEGTTVDNWGERGNADEIVAEETVTITQPGRLLVMTSARGASGCDTGFPWSWIEVDGVELPGAFTVSSSSDSVTGVAGIGGDLSGITKDPLPAGDHTVSFAMRCADGNITHAPNGSIKAVTAVVLGG